ncbi:hypothetical protein [Marmoricola sp. Leaf446]|uniref:hypothetical protein n=1 Tax=Marmoricola sp. Leaf446 TaxID=1736379 RepID=UPI0012E387A0|nr:hypothetical protein [Marmoricola sp. Leaf446]
MSHIKCREADGVLRHRGGRVRRAVVLTVAIGLLLTSGAALALRADRGVYDGQLQLAMFLPPRSAGSNPLAVNSSQAVLFASVVERRISGVRPPPRLTSQSISLAEQGIRTGSQLRMYNGGGQWANDFSRPYLRIDAVGENEREVRAQLDLMADRVRRTADQLQRQQGVRARDRVIIASLPNRPQVGYEGTRSGSAAAVAALLGTALTWAAAAAVARRGRRTSS